MFGSSDGFAWPDSLQGRNTVFPVTQAALVHTNLKAFVEAGLGEWRRVGTSYLWPSQPQMQATKDQKDSERWLHLTRTCADLAVVSCTIQWNHYVHSIHVLWVVNWKFKVLERIARVICKWGCLWNKRLECPQVWPSWKGLESIPMETKDRCFVSEAAGLVRNKTSFARYHLVRDILGTEPAEEKGKWRMEKQPCPDDISLSP